MASAKPPGDSRARRATAELILTERRAANLRRARVIVPVMMLIHAGWGLVFTGIDVKPGGEEAWRDNLVHLHMASVAFTFALSAALHLGRQVRALDRIRDRAGELLCGYGLTVGTLAAINTLHYNFGLTAWIMAMVITAVATQLRLVTQLVLQLGATVAIGVACLASSPELGTQIRNLSNVTLVATISIVLARILDRAFTRELTARRAIETLNRELERRVAEQVGEIVANSERIDALNRQLASQVQARSLELSSALERLAAAQHGEDTLRAGTVIAKRFEIRRLLGVGGMGVVYAAFDRVARADVAVKLVHGNVAGVASAYRFLQEASAAAGLSHPAIVRVLHVDVTDEGRLYQVQELVLGRTLDTWTLRDEPIPPGVVARLGAALADALACAHEAGVVHRDVKPQNVMITEREPGCRLLDFGLAKLRRSLVDSDLSEAGAVIGTPQFLSPEQIAASDTVDGASDIYALGVMLYQCAAARLPYDAAAPIQWLHAHVHDAPLPLPASVGEIAAPIMACLAKAPRDRPTGRELHATFTAIATALEAPPLTAWAARDDQNETRRIAK
ncbi:MAG: serine/threonine protein kinase [Deltaproteobacteria bacterium]|nr:serine/threonine protein kinase [Deltaproteobacteria bacterium]